MKEETENKRILRKKYKEITDHLTWGYYKEWMHHKVWWSLYTYIYHSICNKL